MYQSSNVSIRYKSIDKTLFPKYNKNNIVLYTIEWHDFYDLKGTEYVSILSTSIMTHLCSCDSFKWKYNILFQCIQCLRNKKTVQRGIHME